MDNQTTNVTSPCYHKTAISAWYTLFFLVNIVFCSVVIICHKCESSMNRSFYKILKNLLIADLLYFGDYLVGTAPQVFTCDSFYGDSGAVYIAFGNGITFTCIASNILLMAINRYTAICSPVANDVVFTDKRTTGFCVITWTLGVFAMLINRFLINCVGRFYEPSPSFYTRCSSSLMPTIGPVSMYLYLCTYGTFAFYMLCIIQLKKQSSTVVHEIVTASMFKRQVHVFKQALLISLSMVMTLTTFRILPYIHNSYVRFFLNNIFGLCCVYSTPLIVVAFSSKVRSSIRLVCKKNVAGGNDTLIVAKSATVRAISRSTK